MVLVGITVVTWPDNRVRLVFCDVGQGDGVLVMAGNFQMLIDTGPENNKMVGCLGRHLPFWDKTIEAVVLTHLDSDHSGGLAQVRRYYNVQKNYSGDLVKNDVIKYSPIRFEILNPDRNWGDINKNSVVGVLVVGKKKVLLTGDIAAEIEQKMVWRKEVGKIDILKVSHHGSAEATSDELLMAVLPVEAVISVGKGNKFGHPAKEVVDRLERLGVKIRRTDTEGDIHIYMVIKLSVTERGELIGTSETNGQVIIYAMMPTPRGEKPNPIEGRPRWLNGPLLTQAAAERESFDKQMHIA